MPFKDNFTTYLILAGDGISYLKAVVVNGVPVLELWANVTPAHVQTPGNLLENYYAGGNQLSSQLSSGTLDGAAESRLYMIAANTVDGSQVLLHATKSFKAESAFGSGDGFEFDIPAGTFTLGGKDLGFRIVEGYGACNHANFNTAAWTLITGAPTATFGKQRGATRVRMDMHLPIYTNVVNVGVRYGLRFTLTVAPFTATNFQLGRRFLPGGIRSSIAGHRCDPASNLAAGTYTVAPIWWYDNTFAAGLLFTDTEEMSYTVQEVIQA